jgi:hypothetical protein
MTGLNKSYAWDRQIMKNCATVSGSVRVPDTLSPLSKFTGNLDLASIDASYVGWKIKFTSGKNEGVEAVVQTFTGLDRTITFLPAMTNAIADGDNFTLYNIVRITGNPVDIYARMLLGDFSTDGDLVVDGGFELWNGPTDAQKWTDGHLSSEYRDSATPIAGANSLILPGISGDTPIVQNRPPGSPFGAAAYKLVPGQRYTVILTYRAVPSANDATLPWSIFAFTNPTDSIATRSLLRTGAGGDPGLFGSGEVFGVGGPGFTHITGDNLPHTVLASFIADAAASSPFWATIVLGNMSNINGADIRVDSVQILSPSALLQADFPIYNVSGVAPTGLAFDYSELDVAQIKAERDAWYSGVSMQFDWVEPEDARKFFEEQIFKVIDAYPTLSVDGLFRVRAGRPTKPGGTVIEITDAMADGIPKWERLTTDIVTQVRVYGDFNPATKVYQLLADRSTLDARYSESALGRSQIIEIKSRGLRSSLNGIGLAAARADRLLSRFGTGGPESLEIDAGPTLAFLESGERVLVSLKDLPVLFSQATGKSKEAFEVVRVQMKGTLACTVTVVGFYPVGRPAFIGPDTMAADYASSSQDDQVYSYVSPQTGNFADGRAPYVVI